MKLIISRTYTPNETKDCMIIVDGSVMNYSCKGLELPNNGNQHNVSCIPEGIYDTIKYNSPTKGMVFLLQNVPDREGIEIHAGNFATGKQIDTDGCILPGLAFDDIDGNGTLDVIESKAAMQKLMGYLPDSFKTVIL
jgi:Family of unknown function (DUF5675)